MEQILDRYGLTSSRQRNFVWSCAFTLPLIVTIQKLSFYSVL